MLGCQQAAQGGTGEGEGTAAEVMATGRLEAAGKAEARTAEQGEEVPSAVAQLVAGWAAKWAATGAAAWDAVRQVVALWVVARVVGPTAVAVAATAA